MKKYIKPECKTLKVDANDVLTNTSMEVYTTEMDGNKALGKRYDHSLDWEDDDFEE